MKASGRSQFDASAGSLKRDRRDLRGGSEVYWSPGIKGKPEKERDLKN